MTDVSKERAVAKAHVRHGLIARIDRPNELGFIGLIDHFFDNPSPVKLYWKSQLDGFRITPMRNYLVQCAYIFAGVSDGANWELCLVTRDGERGQKAVYQEIEAVKIVFDEMVAFVIKDYIEWQRKRSEQCRTEKSPENC